MENKNKKCSSKEHEEIDAIYYCQKCQVYMCNKCENFHSKLFQSHQSYNIDKNINDIFTGFCKEKKHSIILEYFCKTHNQLCCAACISKIKGKGNGLHKDCDVCFIEDIKEIKKNKLKSNIKLLEDLSNRLEDSIKQIKIIYEKINENKEELKLKIQKIFTRIRNTINAREDNLLLEVDKYYNEIFFEKIIIESEKLPNEIKISLERGKMIEKDWKDENKSAL